MSRRRKKPDISDAEIVGLPALVQEKVRFSSFHQKCEEFGFDRMLRFMEEGGTITGLARAVGISWESLMGWIDKDYTRYMRFERARIASAEAFAQLALDELEAIKPNATKAEIFKAREKAHHYRWLAAKRDPQTYGDRQEIVVKTPVSELDGAALDAEIAMLTAIAGLKLIPKGQG